MERPASIPQHIWDSFSDEARTIVGAVVAGLERQVAELEQQVQGLKARLDQNSTNSSRPPSTDPIGVKMIDRGGDGAAVGRRLFWQSGKLFEAWHKARDGTIQRSTFLQTVSWLRPMVRSTLERGAACACPKTATTCGELLRLWGCLWTFRRVEGVEPTNNAAERALRHAVIWRRISGGTDSEAGSRFVERMLSVVATCRQRGDGVLDFLTACLRARLDGGVGPSLLFRTPQGRPPSP